MKIDKQKITRAFDTAKSSVLGAGRAVAAGAAGAGLLVGNVVGAVRSKASQVADDRKKHQKIAEGGIVMKKSAFVTLLVALAAVAGVLAALYFYVLRRERELDEYEQLLFSEDFNDELPEEDDDLPMGK